MQRLGISVIRIWAFNRGLPKSRFTYNTRELAGLDWLVRRASALAVLFEGVFSTVTDCLTAIPIKPHWSRMFVQSSRVAAVPCALAPPVPMGAPGGLLQTGVCQSNPTHTTRPSSVRYTPPSGAAST